MRIIIALLIFCRTTFSYCMAEALEPVEAAGMSMEELMAVTVTTPGRG